MGTLPDSSVWICTENSKIHRTLHAHHQNHYVLICFELCLRNSTRILRTATNLNWHYCWAYSRSHQLYESHNAPMETQAQRKAYPLAKRVINHIGSQWHSAFSARNIIENIAQISATPMGSSSYIFLNSMPILCHKLSRLLCTSPARPRARSARPGLEPIFK